MNAVKQSEISWYCASEGSQQNKTLQTQLFKHPRKESYNMLQPKKQFHSQPLLKIFESVLQLNKNFPQKRWSFLEQMLLHPSCRVLGKGSSITPLMGVSFSWKFLKVEIHQQL